MFSLGSSGRCIFVAPFIVFSPSIDEKADSTSKVISMQRFERLQAHIRRDIVSKVMYSIHLFLDSKDIAAWAAKSRIYRFYEKSSCRRKIIAIKVSHSQE